MPKNLEELNSQLEWPKRIRSGGEIVGLRAGKGILDFLGWAIGGEWGEDDFDCGDERSGKVSGGNGVFELSQSLFVNSLSDGVDRCRRL